MFIGVNITFFPQHFLGLAGIKFSFNLLDYVEYSFLIGNIIISQSTLAKNIYPTKVNIPFGPHLLPEYLRKPVRVYKPKLDRNLIGIENKGRTLIYQ
jgi:hypothetical protein